MVEAKANISMLLLWYRLATQSGHSPLEEYYGHDLLLWMNPFAAATRGILLGAEYVPK